MLSQRYRQMIQRCALLVLAGTALQFMVGGLDASFLAYPWGIVLAVNYLYLLIFLYSNADKWKWVRCWMDQPACIVSLASLLLVTLLFGLVRQDGSADGWTGALGFTRMTSSWIFNLLLFHFMTVMGLKVMDDAYHWKKRNVTTLVFHVSFWVILVSAIFGCGDKIRVKITSVVGQPVQMGISADGQPVELPFSLMLKEFSLEEYPPRIHRVDNDLLSKSFIVAEDKGSVGEVDGWQIECLEYLEMAGRMREDSAYASMKHVGATTAVYVKATNDVTHQSAEGWVSCGSHIFTGNVLPLPDGSMLVMPQREVKKYLSKVEIAMEEDREVHEISVNHPLSIGAWKVYQSGYDSSRGRWSTVSILECVRDAWYMPVHIALWVILAAGGWMFVHGWRSHGKGKEERK